jgi:hypothetical protein
MDLRTGEIHENEPGETMGQFYARHRANPDDFAAIDQRPDAKCWRCRGTGRIPKGFGSMRFKPCKCTLIL